jgi:hypothetical protein
MLGIEGQNFYCRSVILIREAVTLIRDAERKPLRISDQVSLGAERPAPKHVDDNSPFLHSRAPLLLARLSPHDQYISQRGVVARVNVVGIKPCPVCSEKFVRDVRAYLAADKALPAHHQDSADVIRHRLAPALRWVCLLRCHRPPPALASGAKASTSAECSRVANAAHASINRWRFSNRSPRA